MCMIDLLGKMVFRWGEYGECEGCKILLFYNFLPHSLLSHCATISGQKKSPIIPEKRTEKRKNQQKGGEIDRIVFSVFLRNYLAFLPLERVGIKVAIECRETIGCFSL
jgi:hypothetical protein